MRASGIRFGLLADRGRLLPRRAAACLAGAAMLGCGAALAGAPAATARAASSSLMADTAAGPACTVAYHVSSDWGSGFSVQVTITNNGPAITSWVLRYSYAGNQQLQNGWSGTWSQSGQAITVTSASWNGNLATGASTAAGANFAYSGTNTAPAGFTVNGVPCNSGNGSQPAVSITSPAAGTTVPSASTVTVSASASANGSGSVSSVTFYADNYCTGTATNLGTVTTAPYTVPWPNVPFGEFAVTAVVTTSQNVSVMSAAVDLTTTVQGHPPTCPIPAGEPAVAIVTPRPGAIAATGATVPVSAVTSIGNGFSISSVTFSAVDTCVGNTTTNLGTVTTAPYTVPWPSIQTGVYSITAVATVNGVSVKSAVVELAAGPNGIPPPCPAPSG
jgi:hypothetical protein